MRANSSSKPSGWGASAMSQTIRHKSRLAVAVDGVEHPLPPVEQSRVEGRRVAFGHAERRGVDDEVGRGDGLGGRGVASVLEAHVVEGLAEAQVTLARSRQVDGGAGQKAVLVHVGAQHLGGAILVAPEQQRLVGAGLGGGVQDGERRGARAAHGHALAGEVEAGPLQVGHAALPVGVVADESIALAHEHVGAVGQARRGGSGRGQLEGERLVGRGDVDGEEVALLEERARVERVGQVHGPVVPGQAEPLVGGVIHHGRLRVGDGVAQHVEPLRRLGRRRAGGGYGHHSPSWERFSMFWRQAGGAGSG